MKYLIIISLLFTGCGFKREDYFTVKAMYTDGVKVEDDYRLKLKKRKIFFENVDHNLTKEYGYSLKDKAIFFNWTWRF